MHTRSARWFRSKLVALPAESGTARWVAAQRPAQTDADTPELSLTGDPMTGLASND